VDMQKMKSQEMPSQRKAMQIEIPTTGGDRVSRKTERVAARSRQRWMEATDGCLAVVVVVIASRGRR